MLNYLLIGFYSIYSYRMRYSNTSYCCGFGTVINRDIDFYIAQGGSHKIVSKLQDLAYIKAARAADL